MTFSDLPAANACFNSISTVFLCCGLYFIKSRRPIAHRNCMIAAFAASVCFLTGYLVYHAHAGETRFTHPAWFRPIYLTLLIPHILLAMVILPLVLITFFFALKGKFAAHKRIARWTWPLWLYVSVTGVLIYVILYHIYPQR